PGAELALPATPGAELALPATPGEIDRVAEIVADTGAVAMVDAMIENRVSAALAALDRAPIDSATRAALGTLAVAATQRRS
ncbi:MAG TPA: polyprenyl synthetase family protein, partial [Asanoa sp.]|nr:polyprenyl synthetase family protein [Asanoa sp.]